MSEARDVISAVYQVTCDAAEIAQQAAEIALEQSVEVPQALVDRDDTEPAVREQFLASVESIQPVPAPADSPGCFAVQIAYPAHLASGQIPQLLNLLYGNISIKNNIRLVDLELPESLLQRLGGPRFGVAGLRALLGVHDRPLLATAIKPRGSSMQRLADIAYRFALGGGDLVKDDHNLVDESLEVFSRRVASCHAAVERANAEAGRRCLYLPNVCGPYGTFEKQLEAVVSAGIRGVLLSPMLVGFDAIRLASHRYGLLVMTHPTFSGTFLHDRRHGIEPGVYLGTLMRLAGADASVYPNSGGRFGFTREECTSIADRLANPLGACRSGWPAPAGGMRLSSLADMAGHYGPDTIYLVGGALLTHKPDLAEGTADFLNAIRQHFPERLTVPAGEIGHATACELPFMREGVVLEHLPFKDFRWTGRQADVYKPSDDGSVLPFRDVVRQELLGKFGEPMAFDLRYFEIEPGGFTSLERHRHVHAVIAVRGHGVLQSGQWHYDLQPMDIAYVPPMQIHQIRNEVAAGGEPFGFFCIVDHVRDRPQAP